MHRYRVNYVLLIGLLVGSLVASGAVYGIWSFQMGRNANTLLTRAETAEGQGDLREAAALLERYLEFNPDDTDVRVRMGEMNVKIARDALEKGEYKDFFLAKESIVNTLFKFPEEDELRSELVSLLMELAPRYPETFAKDTLGHVKVLLDRRPKDTELMYQQATCLMLLAQYQEAAAVLYELIGYDPVADSFSQSQALTPHDINAYRFLTQLLLYRLERKPLAERLQEQMIAANPESADAYLARGKFLLSIADGAGSKNEEEKETSADFQKAYELDPKSPEVLLALAAEAQQNEDFELTRKYLEEGLALGTDNRAFYSGLAQLERVQRDLKAALDQIDRGIAAVDERQRPWLLLDKIEIQIDSGDLADAETTMALFEKEVGRRLPQLDFYDARLLAARGEWFQAAKKLEAVRPELINDARMRVQVDLLLGLAYKSLSQPDRAIESFENVLIVDSGNRIALGQLEELNRTVRPHEIAKPTVDSNSVTGRLTANLNLPEEQQDWAAFDAWLEEQFKVNETPRMTQLMLKSQVFAARKMYSEAQQLLTEADKAEPENLAVHVAAYKLVASDPDGGPEKALKLLDRTVQKFGDQPRLRLDRADMLLAIDREAALPDLLQLTEGIDDWETSQQVQLLNGIAERLNGAGKREEAEQVWLRVAELNPDDLGTLMELFNLALVQNDDEAMAKAQDRILKLVGSKNDSNWAFTDAARLMSRYRRGLEDEAASPKILKLIRTVLEQRPDWSSPYILRATLAMHEQRYLEAEEDYAKGLELGRGNPTAISQYVRLLIAQGKFEAARLALEPYDANSRQLLLGELYPEIMLRTGNLTDAAEAAERIASSLAENASAQLWFGQFMQRVAGAAAARGEGQSAKELRETSLAKAGQALSTVVEINPDDPTGWLAWITYLLTNNERNQAELAIRQAQLKLDEDLQPLFLAQAYEMLGRWFDAENLYRQSYERNPQNTQIARKMAGFYLSPRYPLPDGRAKATVLVNDLLKQFAKDNKSVSRADANWARRTAAQMLAGTGDYQNTLKAEKLLASNSVNGALETEDKVEMAVILAGRPDPVSRKKAIKLLEEVGAGQPLNDNMALMLGQLYFKDGNWPKARDQMVGVISRNAESFGARNAYIRMLLQRGGSGDIREAGTHMARLIEIAPNSPATFELVSLVYSKSDKMEEARQTVKRMVPRDLSKLDENGVRLVQRVAALLTNLGDIDAAQEYYQMLAERPGATNDDALVMAQFIGVYRDPAQGFEMLESLSSDMELTSIIDVGKRILFAQRESVGDQFDDQMETWLARGLREDPESFSLLMLKGEFLDLQRKHEEVATIYRQLLARQDVPQQVRAVLLNNLAYLIALEAVKPQEADESIKLINEAINILGPVADILDTRAVIWMGRKEYEAALGDLELAVIDKPSASKYFHKSLAHLALGQKSAALEAWKMAQELKLEREELNQLERQQYDNLEAQMGRLQA